MSLDDFHLTEADIFWLIFSGDLDRLGIDLEEVDGSDLDDYDLDLMLHDTDAEDRLPVVSFAIVAVVVLSLFASVILYRRKPTGKPIRPNDKRKKNPKYPRTGKRKKGGKSSESK